MKKSYAMTLSSPKGIRLTASSEAEAPLRLVENGWEGFGATELFVETEPYASGRGAHPILRRFGERYLTLTAELCGDADRLRRQICTILDPLDTLVLHVSLGGVGRRISVIPCGKPLFRQATLYTPVTVELPFIAPEPFFEDDAAYTVHFRNTAPLLAFPLNTMTGAGTVSGMRSFSQTVNAPNPGDTECGLCMVLTVSGGAVSNPALTCLGQTLCIAATLADGDTVEVDTRPRRKNVRINGERRFAFTRNSEFFLLPRGGASLTLSAASGMGNLDAVVSYTPLYYGI